MTYFGVMHNIFEILPGKENKDVPSLFPPCVNMYTSGYLALFRNSFRRGFRLVNHFPSLFNSSIFIPECSF